MTAERRDQTAEHCAAQTRIAELESALIDAEFLLRKVGINWKESASMKDSMLRSAENARAILSKGQS